MVSEVATAALAGVLLKEEVLKNLAVTVPLVKVLMVVMLWTLQALAVVAVVKQVGSHQVTLLQVVGVMAFNIL
jgi:hypothetical protein